MTPFFSVIIPAYNQADFLQVAIKSVLSQTYKDFELIIVNDASPDHTEQVVRKFTDPRIKYLVHAQNQGLPAARNTGMRASSGCYIALLDSDDYYHQDKLMVHDQFLEAHPEIGVTYNPRYNLNHSSTTIRNLYRPQRTVDLTDLVLGFPFSPSDMVIRREWVDRVGYFDETLINGAEDMEYPCRLALAGCKFASVDKALNYRRYNLNKSKRSMSKRKEEYDRVLSHVFQDPNCSEEVKALEDKAIAMRTLNLAFVSLINENTGFAQELIQEVIEKGPDMISGVPAPLIDALLDFIISNSNENHEDVLRKLLEQFPEELKYLDAQYFWAVKQGYLRKIARIVLWENVTEAEELIKQAHSIETRIEEFFLQKLLFQLIDIDEVLGVDICQQMLDKLFPVLWEFGTSIQLRRLEGQLSLARVFKSYQDGKYQSSIQNVFETFRKNPKACLNKGVISIFAKSMIRSFSFEKV